MLFWGYFGSYFLYVSPNFTGWLKASSGWIISNYAISALSLVKAFLDAFAVDPQGFQPVPGQPKLWRQKWQAASPFIEATINVLWLIPAIGSYASIDKKRRTKTDGLFLAANICFDVGGSLLAPAEKIMDKPPYGTIIYGTCLVVATLAPAALIGAASYHYEPERA